MYAETLGITNLGEPALQGLAQDVEYRVRELIQVHYKDSLTFIKRYFSGCYEIYGTCEEAKTNA